MVEFNFGEDYKPEEKGWHSSSRNLRAGDVLMIPVQGDPRLHAVVRTSPTGATIIPLDRRPVRAGNVVYTVLPDPQLITLRCTCDRLNREEVDKPTRRVIQEIIGGRQGGYEAMAKTRKRTAKKATKKRAAAPPVGGDEPAKKTRKKAAPKEPTNDCVCGCGVKVRRYFAPGHDARFKGWLTRIGRGEGPPSQFMSKSLEKALGPWKKKGDGLIPSKDYRDLREL